MPAAARRPGRRKSAPQDVVAKHHKILKAARKKQMDTEDEAKKARVELAMAIDAAQNEGVATNLIAGWLDYSRQMLSKLVKELVDGGSPRKGGSKQPAAKKKNTKKGSGSANPFMSKPKKREK